MNETIKVLIYFSQPGLSQLSFIVGLYGMNFKYMPELEWKYQFAMPLQFWMVSAMGMSYYFKKERMVLKVRVCSEE